MIVAVKLAKTLPNFAQIVMFDFNQTSHNDFAHTFAKSMICYHKVKPYFYPNGYIQSK